MKFRKLFLLVFLFTIFINGESLMQFPIKPIVYPFPYSKVSGLYPVPFSGQIFVDPYPTGRLQFVTLKPDGKLEQKILPYGGGDVRSLVFCDNNRKMYLCEERAILFLEIEKMKTLLAYPQKIEHISYKYNEFFLLDEGNQNMVIYEEFNDWEDPEYIGGMKVKWCQYTIASLKDNRIIKRLSLKNKKKKSPSVFTKKGIIFHENNEEATQWRAMNYAMEPIEHPLLKVLNDSKELFLWHSLKLFVFDAYQSAVIFGMKNIQWKNALYIAAWAKEPKFTPIIIPDEEESSVVEDRVTVSPSGKWLFASMDDKRPNPRNYLIRLAPEISNGYLPPFKLPLEGEPQAVSWTTEPEGLVIAMSQRLIWWDLSQFKVEDYLPKK